MAEIDYFGQLGGLASGVGTTLVGVFGAVLFAVILIGVMWFIRETLRYNIKVEIIERVGDTELTYFTKAREAKFDGVPKLFIKKLNRYESIPKAELFTPVKSTFSWSKLIRFYKSGEAMQPMDIMVNSPASLTPIIDSDVELWYSLENQRAYETYNKQSFLDRYGTYVAVGGLFVLVFVMGLVFFQQFESIADAFRGAASELAKARSQTISAG